MKQKEKTWVLLNQIANGVENVSEFDYLLKSVDFCDFMDLIIRNKVHGFLALEIAKNNIQLKHEEFNKLFFNILKSNVYRNEKLTKEACVMSELFNRKGIRFVSTKGIILNHIIYDENGSRMMGDIDFMVHPEDKEKVLLALQELNYVFGSYDYQTKSVKPHPRKKEIEHLLFPDHLPHSIRIVDDSLMEFIVVDIAFDLTWHTSDWNLPVSEALKSSVPVQTSSGVLYSFNPYYQFIFTCLHLFKDAYHYRYVIDGSDVNFVKFMDVLRILKKFSPTWDNKILNEILNTYAINDPIFWVVRYIDQVFDEMYTANLGIGQIQNKELLNTIRLDNGKKASWPGDMIERILSTERASLFRM